MINSKPICEKQFDVTITETLERTVIITGCNTAEEAEERARVLYYDEKIILYPESCVSVGFESKESKTSECDKYVDKFDMEHDEPI